MHERGPMKPAELAKARGELVAFAAEMLASLPRSDQRRWGETYLRGLMLDGRRKSIEPMAARLADGDEQCLQQFVNQSPWEWEPVRERLAARMSDDDRAARLDHRRHRLSQGGALLGRRRPPVLGHARQGRQLPDRRLDLGRLRGGQLPAYLAPLPAGRLGRRCAAPRQGAPAGRASIIGRSGAWPWRCSMSCAPGGLPRRRSSPMPATARSPPSARPWRNASLPTSSRSRPRPAPTARTCSPSDPPGAARAVRRRPATAARPPRCAPWPWRRALRGGLRGRLARGLARPDGARFLALRVRPANVGLRRAHGAALPLAWLLCQWPEGEAEPSKYWLANLPAETTLVDLVRLAKLRWRIEQDYRELKDALGLDHFEGRSFRGWHHHVTLVSLAHGFLTLQRLDPKADAPA